MRGCGVQLPPTLPPGDSAATMVGKISWYRLAMLGRSLARLITVSLSGFSPAASAIDHAARWTRSLTRHAPADGPKNNLLPMP